MGGIDSSVYTDHMHEGMQHKNEHSQEGYVEGIAAAALEYQGELFVGEHHRNAAVELKRAHPDAKPTISELHHGFVTTWGRFVDRKEAKEIAMAAGQADEFEDELNSDHIKFYLPMQKQI